jgi:hypothetical protein
LTLTQSTVSDNTVHNLSGPQSLGGGILHGYGSFVAGQSVIAGNVATATFGLGGGLYTGGSAAEINGGQILSNTAREGGGWRNTVNDALLIGGEVRFNLATQYGGGIYNEPGQQRWPPGRDRVRQPRCGHGINCRRRNPQSRRQRVAVSPGFRRLPQSGQRRGRGLQQRRDGHPGQLRL